MDGLLRDATLFWLVGARLFPLALLTPWLVYRRTPSLLRSGVALGLAFMLSPFAARHAAAVPTDTLGLVLACLTEAGIGGLFALVTAVPLLALQWGGWLSDLWRNGLLADAVKPATAGLAELYGLLAVSVFWTVGVPLHVVEHMVSGFETLPVGSAVLLTSFGDVARWIALVLLQAVALAAVIAAPVALGVVLVELFSAFLVRMAPSAASPLSTLPWRASIGLLAALVALSFLVARLPADFEWALAAARTMLVRLSR